MKVGIVVPFSWSFWGGVNEHADQQARTLIELGHEARIICGNDPPGRFTHLLHPREGRHEPPPEYVLPVGRSVIVPANGTLPNIVLSPSAFPRMRRIFARERFDVVHVHEPLAPLLSAYALAIAECPVAVTCHSSAGRWWPIGKTLWGFVAERIDHRIAVSEQAKRAAEPYIGGPIEVIPNGVAIPSRADPGGRLQNVVFIGRHDPRKGLEVLLRAWPDIRARTGARLRLVGADPLSVAWLVRRKRLSLDGVDVLGSLSEDALTDELSQARVLTAPSIGRESFGMVLTRAFACATPVVASDIEGYRDVVKPAAGVLVPPGDPGALAEAVVGVLEDPHRAERMGAAARQIAIENYAWTRIVGRFVDVYEQIQGVPVQTAMARP